MLTSNKYDSTVHSDICFIHAEDVCPGDVGGRLKGLSDRVCPPAQPDLLHDTLHVEDLLQNLPFTQDTAESGVGSSEDHLVNWIHLGPCVVWEVTP